VAGPRKSADVDKGSDATLSEHAHEGQDMAPGAPLIAAYRRRGSAPKITPSRGRRGGHGLPTGGSCGL